MPRQSDPSRRNASREIRRAHRLSVVDLAKGAGTRGALASLVQTKSSNGLAAADLTSDALVEARASHDYERDVRSEAVRWAWTVAAWEMANTPPEEPIELQGYDEAVLVVVYTDLVS